ncbi:MAG: T9SS type A sorting domain-containing protein, partial [Bacteroidota bacterium]
VRSQNVCASSAYLTKSVTVNNCPRVGENEISEIKIQPNPFSEFTILRFPEEYNLQQVKLHVIDINGKLVRQITAPENVVVFERKNLKSGIYSIEVIKNEQIISVKRIIIE